MCSKKRVQKSDSLVLFRVSAWSPRRSQGGPHAQKHLKMEPQTCIFCSFRIMPSRSVETLWKYFVCSMNNKLIVLDVQFTVVFA